MSDETTAERYARWKADPVAFITDVLSDPDTGRPFELLPAEIAFMREAFRVDADGRLIHPELLYAAPKKSGKTCFAALVALYVVLVLGGRHAEGIVCANDLEQAQGRVFAAIKRMVEVAPWLAREANVTQSRIDFPQIKATITAIASDYASAAGSNANIVVFDELWAYTSERSRRLWDECVPPPTRKIACRLTTTYAGFDGESTLLEGLYKRGLAQLVGEDLHAGDGLLMFWSYKPVAPWQTAKWVEQMRAQLRPNAFLRMIENRFVSGEDRFVDPAWWDACIDSSLATVFREQGLPVWIGIDASVKHDTTAIVVVTWDRALNKVRLVAHKVFQPTPAVPLNFEWAIEGTVRDLRERFFVRGVYYDPYQMAAVAQRLAASGVPMREYAQTIEHLTAIGSNLYDLIKSRAIIAYPDDGMKLAMSRAVALETRRGFKITKEKTSHKIDVVVALAMASLACVREGQYTAALVAPIIIRADGSVEQVGMTAAGSARARAEAGAPIVNAPASVRYAPFAGGLGGAEPRGIGWQSGNLSSW